MTTNRDAHRPAQQDARVWAKNTGTNYTTALRAVDSPLTRGILGKKITARRLIQVLDRYPDLGDNGMNAPTPYRDDNGMIQGSEDLFQSIILVAEMLQMFTPAVEPTIGSYGLKHTVEKFLAPTKLYITNGQLIWAAAAIDLPISEPDDSPNVMIGISEIENTYVFNAVQNGRVRPTAHHYQPPRWNQLRQALEQYQATGEIGDVGQNLMALKRESGDLRFHDWLLKQTGRDDYLGKVAEDYHYGTDQGQHQIAYEPGDLLVLLEEVRAPSEFVEAAHALTVEWNNR